MKIYELSPKDDLPLDENLNPWFPWYDKVFRFIVRAGSEQRAREIASDNHGGEGPDAWLNPIVSKCVELLQDGEEEIILIG